MESKEIVWEENTFTKFNIVRICIILFMVWGGIVASRVSFGLNFFILILSLILTIISFCLLLWLLFFEKSFFLIRFTEGDLFIKNRIIMFNRKYLLSDIATIEVKFIRKNQLFQEVIEL